MPGNYYTSPVGIPGAEVPPMPARPSDSSLYDTLVNAFGWGYPTPAPDSVSGEYMPNVPLIPGLTGESATAQHGLPLEYGIPSSVQNAITGTNTVDEKLGRVIRATQGSSTFSPDNLRVPTQSAQSVHRTTAPVQSSDPRVLGQVAQPVQELPDAVFGPQSGPIQYTTDGGRSTVTGGYGDQSQLAAWGLARYFGQDNPAQMAQRNSLARTMAARNSTEYQNAYQTALRQTGNPMLASAQADALFAEQQPNYAGDFINSGQDVNTQQRFDQGLARLNATAAIDPYTGQPTYQSGLPTWGTYASGVMNGHTVASTPTGNDVVLPTGASPAMLTTLTGAAGTQKAGARDPNQLTASDRIQLMLGQERNQQSRINNIGTMINNLQTQLGYMQKNGADAAAQAELRSRINVLNQQYGALTGITMPAQPIITNSNTGSNR